MDNFCSSFDKFNESPIIISPNIGFPIICTRINKQKEESEQYTFCMMVVANKDTKITELHQQLEKHCFATPLLDLDTTTMKLRRGTPIILNINQIQLIDSLCLNDHELTDLYDLEKGKKAYILRHEFFGKNKELFAVYTALFIQDNNQVQEWLNKNSFIMFDLQQTFPALNYECIRTCYHSFVITNNAWNNIKFAQITDLHIAKRFDEFLSVITNNSQANQEKKLYNILSNTENRYHNPNNYLRKFIKWANQKTKSNGLDFVLITGDIIDYYLKNDFQKMESYELEESNWDIFLNILLNEPIETRPGCKPLQIFEQQEIALPIFTITGNHDVRVNGYPLRSGGIYKHFGLNIFDVMKYSDPHQKSKLSALKIDKYCLKPYYQYINPFDDYFLIFGNNVFLMMNSGSDTFLDLKSMLMSNPSSTGLSKKQMQFAKKIGSLYMQENAAEGLNFFIMHSPMLNPVPKNIILRYFMQRKKLISWIKRWKYKEQELRQDKKNEGNIEEQFDFTHGVISHHWLDMLTIMLRYNMIGCMGHTHQWREFRFIFSRKEAEFNHKSGEIRKNPFHFYWDNYSEDYSSNFLTKDRPFVFQTPSLGIAKEDEEPRRGPIRLIQIQGNRIENMKILFLSEIF